MIESVEWSLMDEADSLQLQHEQAEQTEMYDRWSSWWRDDLWYLDGAVDSSREEAPSRDS